MNAVDQEGWSFADSLLRGIVSKLAVRLSKVKFLLK